MPSLKHRPENSNKPYTVRWREHGSNRRRSFRLKSEAKAFLAKAHELEAAPPSPAGLASQRTLDEQWQHFVSRREHEVAATTLNKQRWAYTKWLKPRLANRKLHSITHEDLGRVLTTVSEAGRSNDTRIAVYTTLNMVLDDALGKGGHTCRQAVAGTSKRKHEVNPLTDEQLGRLLDVLPSDSQDHLLVDMLATLGVRPHEALGIDVRRDLGYDNDVVISVTVRTRKRASSTQRTLPLPKRLQKPLTRMKTARDAEGEARLFTIPDWRTWRRRVFKQALKDAELDPATRPYDLRHTCASRLIANGATPADVAEWLGHDVRTTLQTYAHLFPGRKQELANLLDR